MEALGYVADGLSAQSVARPGRSHGTLLPTARHGERQAVAVLAHVSRPAALIWCAAAERGVMSSTED